MRAITRGVALCLLMLPLAAGAFGKKKQAEPSASGCIENLSVSGGWSTGKSFLASVDHEGVPYPVAFRKTVAAVEADGLININANERTGYIAADNPVKGGGGSTVPLRATVIRQPDSSIRVEVRFSIKGGQMTTNKTVGTSLCAIAEAASIDDAAPAADAAVEG